MKTDLKTGLMNLMDQTKGLVIKYTPGLKRVLKPYVHSGFWDAYTKARTFVHKMLRSLLKERPCEVIFTGHSLGGALASIASLDVAIHTLPRINNYLAYQKNTM